MVIQFQSRAQSVRDAPDEIGGTLAICIVAICESVLGGFEKPSQLGLAYCASPEQFPDQGLDQVE